MVHVRPGHDVRVVLRHVLDAPPLRVRQLLLAHLDGARVVAVLQLERDEEEHVALPERYVVPVPDAQDGVKLRADPRLLLHLANRRRRDVLALLHQPRRQFPKVGPGRRRRGTPPLLHQQNLPITVRHERADANLMRRVRREHVRLVVWEPPGHHHVPGLRVMKPEFPAVHRDSDELGAFLGDLEPHPAHPGGDPLRDGRLQPVGEGVDGVRKCLRVDDDAAVAVRGVSEHLDVGLLGDSGVGGGRLRDDRRAATGRGRDGRERRRVGRRRAERTAAPCEAPGKAAGRDDGCSLRRGGGQRRRDGGGRRTGAGAEGAGAEGAEE